jgi:small subunit ribosomal protein S6
MQTANKNTYETVYILRSGITEDSANTIHSKVDSVVSKFSGEIKAKDDWGLKELAFPIQKESMGRYNVVVFNGTGGVVEEIERHFKIFPDVIRFLTVVVEDDYDYQKSKKQILASEEELKKVREARKKGV